MKLVVLGGAGVRAPLLMSALARRQRTINLTDVVLVDIDQNKLDVMAPLVRYASQKAGATFGVTSTLDAEAALTDAGAVITTIRVGAERGRALDERIALEHGVLGQETTGAGGFAMALRTIPVLIQYAELIWKACPGAWLLNFTNPAGLVVQALTARFPDLRIAGICDTPSSLHRRVAAMFGRETCDVPVRFYGLNHLSWLVSATVDGENVVPRILEDRSLATRIPETAFFERELLHILGELPNEYLYFYYYRDRALANIRSAAESRGQQVERLSAIMLENLRGIDPARNPERAWDRYSRYLNEREESYLALETGGHAGDDVPVDGVRIDPAHQGEGYAGVAVDILAAEAGHGGEVTVNVANRGAIPGMSDDDVVEVTCRCDATGLHPIAMEPPAEDQLLLMKQVKRYERLAVEAIDARSRQLATRALMAHPLIGSYSTARSLVDAYLQAHRQYVGDWATW